MNVVVIAPHPDDESIGCGGSICIHAEEGDRVTAVFLTSGEAGLPRLAVAEAMRVREREAEKAAEILGISSLAFMRKPDHCLAEAAEETAEALKSVLNHEKPELIYLPHERDFHADHRAAVAIVETALRGTGFPMPTLLSYEVLTPLTEYDRAQNISPVIERKLRAVCAHLSQVEQFRYDLAARALNEYRGIVVSEGRYAEVFRVSDGCLKGISSARRADPAWHRFYQASREITRAIPAEESLILVDEGQLEAGLLLAPRPCIPFLEKDGRYWGKPPDDATAIGEIERLRESGASFLVFAWSTFWWLDHYSGLQQYLRANFACIRQSDQVVIFDLKARDRAKKVA